MLTRLKFKNFKAWKDSGDIRLAPLTVFFGANSAGKTSVSQLLLLLKQTAESPDRQRALRLGDSRTLVDLGTYADAIHNHDLSKDLEVVLEWTLGAPLDIVDSLSVFAEKVDRVRFEVNIRADERERPQVEFMQYTALNGNAEVLRVSMVGHKADTKFDLSAHGYNLIRRPGRAWPLPEPVRFYGFPDEVRAYYQNPAFTSDLVLAMEQMLGSFFYVGPLRESPKRLYLWSGEVPDHVGVRGDRAVEAILGAGDRKFNFGPRQRTKPLSALVAERLQAMGLISSFEVKSLGEHRKEYEVLVRTARRLPQVKLTDVGFGVSQVLPVIVECFYVPARSIVFFEQPEIHLHPRVQSELADVFIDALRAREDGHERQCQFIVESHSEHFLRRLQRLIAEEKIPAEDTALYFVTSRGDGASVQPLEVDMFGNIHNWPDDFFGDDMGDLVARTEAQAERMARGGGE